MALTLQSKSSGGIIFVIIPKIITKENVPRIYFVIISARMVHGRMSNLAKVLELVCAHGSLSCPHRHVGVLLKDITTHVSWMGMFVTFLKTHTPLSGGGVEVHSLNYGGGLSLSTCFIVLFLSPTPLIKGVKLHSLN